MTYVYLISCAKSKQSYPCTAGEMYVPSTKYKAALQFASNRVDDRENQIFILSAKYGLLSLSDPIIPYDLTLESMPPTECAEWGKRVYGQISKKFDMDSTVFIFLATQAYINPLRKYLPYNSYDEPLKGMRQFEQTQWLQQNAMPPGSMCARLHKLFNDMPRFSWNTIDNIGFDNGIYVLFEVGEKYCGMDRIVRVGTHTSNGRLLRRLKDHFISENKDGSIFRKNIGKAILNKNKHPYLDVWSADTSKKENITRLGCKYDRALQAKIEENVTKYMRKNFTFVCFPVTTEEERLHLEEGIIATLNNASDFAASAEWRGKYSTEKEIVQSGLWLKQGLGGVPLSEEEFVKIVKLCSGMPSYDSSPAALIKNELAALIMIPPKHVSVKNYKTADIETYLTDKMRCAKVAGATSLRTSSGEIAKELEIKNRFPTVCGAMRKLMKADDIIHHQPPKGNGSTLEIEYFL